MPSGEGMARAVSEMEEAENVRLEYFAAAKDTVWWCVKQRWTERQIRSFEVMHSNVWNAGRRCSCMDCRLAAQNGIFPVRSVYWHGKTRMKMLKGECGEDSNHATEKMRWLRDY